MTDIEMLPLPEWTKRDDAGQNMVPSEIRVAMADYASAVAEHNVASRDAEIEALRAEMEKLRELCGCAYQMAGYHDAPVEWLDALGDAGDGTPLDEWRVQAKDPSDVLLPYQPDNNSHEDAEIERLRAEVERQKQWLSFWGNFASRQSMLAEQAEARAERLAEALRLSLKWDEVMPAGEPLRAESARDLDTARAALLDHDKGGE